MSINLNVPAIEDKPSLIAETHPKKIQEMLGSLPMNDPQASANVVVEMLTLLNRQKASLDHRLKALEVYLPYITDLIEGLSRGYCGTSLPLSESARNHALLAQQLFTELAYGYKHAIHLHHEKIISLGSTKQLANLIYQAIHALSQLLVVCYEIYSPPIVGVWAEIHLLYLHAVQESVADTAIIVDETETSINQLYKHTLLVALADPYRLTHTDLVRVIDYLNRFANLALLQPLGKLENPAGVFLVRLKLDRPPIPYAKNNDSTDIRTDILLITIDLARKVHNHASLLQSREKPQTLGLPEYGSDQRYQDMLVHLIKHWGNPPHRMFGRFENLDPIDLSIGIAATHYYINNENQYLPSEGSIGHGGITLNLADMPSAGSSTVSYNCSSCVVMNESAGGVALGSFDDAQISLRVGEILGLRPEKSSEWRLGVVRWASNSENSIEIGAQMLAPNAIPVALRPVEESTFIPAFLLPESPALKQPATLLAPRGLHRPAREVEIDRGGKQSSVLLTRLVERTNTFERFQFSPI